MAIPSIPEIWIHYLIQHEQVSQLGVHYSQDVGGKRDEANADRVPGSSVRETRADDCVGGEDGDGETVSVGGMVRHSAIRKRPKTKSPAPGFQ